MTTVASKPAYGGSKERVRRKQAEATARYREKNKEKIRKRRKEKYHLERVAASKRRQDPETWAISALRGIRYRSRKQGLECTISAEDIPIPDVCPALGTAFVFKNEGNPGIPHQLSPSVDRIDPSRGYVPGNVAVISLRANRIKYNATPDEIRSILSYMESVN